jgi:hypothetical protein
MNKNEQNRVVAWRLKILREADEMPRGVAQTCRHFGLSRKTFYKRKPDTRAMVRPAYATARECRSDFRRQHLERWSPRSCICVIDIILDRAGPPLT